MDQGLTKPQGNASGWDNDINGDLTLLERGFVVPLVCGPTRCATGQVVTLNSSGHAIAYDPKSCDLPTPFGLGYQVTSPQNTGYFIKWGGVSSFATWSAALGPNIGSPAFVSPVSPGVITGPFTGAMVQAGWITKADEVVFDPRILPPQKITDQRCGFANTSAVFSFAMTVGRRGFNRDLRVTTKSCDNYHVSFWADSARTSVIYDTAILSGNLSVRTITLRDDALWPYEATDTASWMNIYGQVEVLSSAATAINSDVFNVLFVGEQVR